MEREIDGSAGGISRRGLVQAAGGFAAGALVGNWSMNAVAGQESRPGPEGIVAMDALALSDAIRARKLSCVEVMRAFLAQIDRLNSRVNAIVALRPAEELMREARARDEELARGVWRGWMHGFPHAVKDLSDVRGIVNSKGSPILRNNVSRQDSVFVERLRAAGAIFVGKTNVPEFGLGSQTYNSVYGTTRNAWDTTLTAGGSSGGAAVALALRMVPVADGSDMMGSLRNPAAWNNVIGFRPSYGRVPGDGPDYLQQLGYAGPMARTVPELARLLSTMAGFDPRDPLSIAEDPDRFAAPLQSDPRGLRIGWLGDYGGHLPMEPGVLELCRAALGTFGDLGCHVEEAHIDFDMGRLWQTWTRLRSWLMAAIAYPLYEKPDLRALLKPEALWEIENGLAVTGLEAAQASAVRGEWYSAMRRAFERWDFLVLPSAQVFPFDAALHWPREIAGRPLDTYHRWMEVVIGGSLSGCPVVSVPAGFSPGGLPMGIQLIAPMHHDFRVLQLAAAYEEASGWTGVAYRPRLLGA